MADTRAPTAAFLLGVVLLTAGCKLGRYSAGHPLESTQVVGWEELAPRRLALEVRFRDDAPSYGCLLEAFSSEGESIGYKRARPRGESERTIEMFVREGTAGDVVDVRVTDCDV